MRKWRTADVWAAAVVGTLAVGATAGLIAMSGKFYAEEGVTYTVDLASTRENQSWTTSLDPELAASLASDRYAGTPCELPEDLTFRGVILRGRDIHGRVLDYRVFPDRYYIEYRDHRVRCVYDSAPWGPVSEEVRAHLNPRLQDLLVKEGVPLSE